jgi:hypothetical protein
MAEYEVSPFTKEMERVDAKIPINDEVITGTPFYLGENHSYVPFDASLGIIEVYLPPSTGATRGTQMFLSKRDASDNKVIIYTSGTDTINGKTKVEIACQYTTLHLLSVGNGEWIII